MAKVYKRKDINKRTYYAHFSVRGKRYRIKLDAQNKEQAKKLAAEAEFQVLQGNYKILEKSKVVSLKELSEKYIEYAKSNKRSWDRDVVSLKNLLNMEIDNKKLGDYDIKNIKVADVQKYQIRRKRELDVKYESKGISEQDRNYATVNRELACLRHIFYMGIEWEMLSKNPVVSKSIKFDKEKSRSRTLSDDEFTRLVSSCTGHLRQIVLIALNTGMRQGEILGLKWVDVDLNERKIEVKHTKSDEDRVIPINDFLFDILGDIDNEKELLFFNNQGEKIKSFKTAWGKAIKRANLENFRFHDLRHTVASRLAKAKVPESVIALILGHKRASITSRYINPQWDEMIEAVEILGSLCHGFVTVQGNDDDSEVANDLINKRLA